MEFKITDNEAEFLKTEFAKHVEKMNRAIDSRSMSEIENAANELTEWLNQHSDEE